MRLTLRYLRAKFGAWTPLAAALRLEEETPSKIVVGKRGVTVAMAFRVARLVQVLLAALLDGRYVPAGTCPCCGHPPIGIDGEGCPSRGQNL